MNEYVITLDVGKFDTKAIGRSANGTAENIKRVSFRTKMYDMDKGYIDLEGNSYKVTLGNKEYIIGEQGENKSNETSKTNMLHKLAAYTAITEYLEPNTKDNNIKLVLACPLSVLKVQEAKEEYKEFIKGSEEINIKVNDKEYNFIIDDVTIKAEGSGILYLEPETFKNKNIAIVDFGGLNMGFSLYQNGVCKQSGRFIEEHGVNALTLLVQDKLTAINKGNLVPYNQAEQALENGYATKLGNVDAESASKVTEAKTEFFDKALEIIGGRGYHLDQYDGIVFVGGTTQKLKETIVNKFPNATIPTNSQWTTAEGLYKIACAKYNK
ncbi:recombinase (plasmid) [Clostridium botulinum]|uniref:ParM/StbA family protein n=1 Tax=Clostridium botulinum TaxID=1491 RepID=UPI000C77EAEA|nr:ParM/StbA family protein [Clostridium botulinum]AUN19951.1 recombinase [Clostridium botulinum]